MLPSHQIYRRFLAVAFATTAPLAASPVITEIMYHPEHRTDSRPTAEPLGQEFIELHKPTGTTLDLAGYTFTDGVAYSLGYTARHDVFGRAGGPVHHSVGNTAR